MKLPFLSLLPVLLAAPVAHAQTAPVAEPPTTYRFAVNLNELEDDKLKVTLQTPTVTQKTVVYCLPKIIPGTYAVHNYGRFVSGFTATARDGSALPVKKLDENRWEIGNADTLKTITYSVDDTWDAPKKSVTDMFEPSGTEFDKNVFVLNPFGLVGYFDGLKNQPFSLSVTKPKAFFGATALVDRDASDMVDTFETKNYGELADAPVLYHLPNTTKLLIGDTEVLVSVYSPNKKVTSQVVADKLVPMLNAQKAYLGNKLPVKKYAFLIYLTPNIKATAFGALEHSRSSLYFMPEFAPVPELVDYIADVAAHEFLHILTPLTIHSEEIGDFDYTTPRMSKHLWLYEGLTEYAAGHAQLKGGIIALPAYLSKQREKIVGSEQYDDKLPFTELSTGVLEKHKNQYMNVYEKGALIGLCLDVKLRQLSDGRYGTQNLMQDLSKQYGTDKSFKDDELFDIITKLTYPQIGEFFKKYVAGSEPLPLKETFAAIGVEYAPTQTISGVRLLTGLRLNADGTFSPAPSEAGKKAMSKLAESLGIKEDDKIVSLNGEKLTRETVAQFVGKVRELKDGDPLSMTVLRKNADGKEGEVVLTGKAFKEDVESKHLFRLLDDAAAGSETIRLRNAWMK